MPKLEFGRVKGFSITLRSEADTQALGGKIARACRIGDVIFLEGPLGAGKTVLARGLVQQLQGPCDKGPCEVTSPTFTFVEIYDEGAVPVWHFDFYRLEKPEDVYELGIEEALDSAVCVIEWPGRARGLIDAPALTIELQIAGEHRIAKITVPDRSASRFREEAFAAPESP